MLLEIEDTVTELPQAPPDFIDFEAHSQPKTVSPTALRDLTALAKKLMHQQERKAFYEGKLAECSKEINQLESVELPDLMFSVGLREFTTENGGKIEIKDIVSGTITEPKREAALAWLKDHGHSGIIKHQFKVELPKDAVKDVKKAAALKIQLEKLGLSVVDQETVHPQTLCAWAREMLADPATAAIPLDTLGIYVGKRATVKQSR
jgi:hypothetical protein